MARITIGPFVALPQALTIVDVSGTVSVGYTLTIGSGTLQAGTYTGHMVGQTSGVSLSASFTVGDCAASVVDPAGTQYYEPSVSTTGSGQLSGSRNARSARIQTSRASRWALWILRLGFVNQQDAP